MAPNSGNIGSLSTYHQLQTAEAKVVFQWCADQGLIASGYECPNSIRFFAILFIPGPSKIPVTSCHVKHRAFESQAGMFDLEFLYGLKKGSKKEVIEWCMGMDMIAKEYVCPTCGEKMVLTEKNCSDGYAWVCQILV
ncbi:hypothetical protein AVEN_188023-1 [Araneus ventricosus]|uniref:Uncharacterized protein n=1 Tax=Araneus ventricosus TaxID=182803 RepID=A0A4Y2VYS4_ARAVE|nr:hypothetical protein AVEN_188023-1 [Araneus ventricosus]